MREVLGPVELKILIFFNCSEKGERLKPAISRTGYNSKLDEISLCPTIGYITWESDHAVVRNRGDYISHHITTIR